MTAEDRPFGNLTFSSYTMETDAERCLLAIQAALRVHGYSSSHPTMKKVLRLKRSMTRNKVRRYTFTLIPTSPDVPQTRSPAPVPEDDKSRLIAPILEEVTGLVFHSKESKVASSGHFLVKFVLVGRIHTARISPGAGTVTADKAREEVAARVVRDLKDELSSFSVQPFRIRADMAKNVIGLSVQCIYRGVDASKA